MKKVFLVLCAIPLLGCGSMNSGVTQTQQAVQVTASVEGQLTGAWTLTGASCSGQNIPVTIGTVTFTFTDSRLIRAIASQSNFGSCTESKTFILSNVQPASFTVTPGATTYYPTNCSTSGSQTIQRVSSNSATYSFTLNGNTLFMQDYSTDCSSVGYPAGPMQMNFVRSN